jgi:hypothetical protein
MKSGDWSFMLSRVGPVPKFPLLCFMTDVRHKRNVTCLAISVLCVTAEGNGHIACLMLTCSVKQMLHMPYQLTRAAISCFACHCKHR